MNTNLHEIVTPFDRSNGSIISIQRITGDTIYQGVEQYRLCYMSDNLEIIGYLVLPELVTEKLPILIVNHGGCDNWSKINGGLRFLGLDYFSELSTKGPYIVLASQYRGIDGGEGKDEWGGNDIDDVLNLLPVAARIPTADTSKIVMVGFSRGGTMTYEAIKAGFPLKAAVVVSGGTDLIENYEERNGENDQMQEILRKHLGGTPTEVPEAYRSRSAFYWPEQINVPTLILHGDADDAVSVKQAQKLSAELDRLGKDHKLVVVKNGDHCLANYPQLRDQLILQWFAEHLATA